MWPHYITSNLQLFWKVRNFSKLKFNAATGKANYKIIFGIAGAGNDLLSCELEVLTLNLAFPDIINSLLFKAVLDIYSRNIPSLTRDRTYPLTSEGKVT